MWAREVEVTSSRDMGLDIGLDMGSNMRLDMGSDMGLDMGSDTGLDMGEDISGAIAGDHPIVPYCSSPIIRNVRPNNVSNRRCTDRMLSQAFPG